MKLITVEELVGSEQAPKPLPRPCVRMRQAQDGLLARISSGICDGASELHRLELERLGRKAEAACQLQEMLAGLQDLIARRTARRAGTAVTFPTVEIPYQAA